MVDVATRVVFKRMPQDDEELWYFVQAVWGVRIARQKVCRDHVAPFTAFADAYFARHPVAIWKASRGFGGKSFQLSLLAHTEAVGLGAQSTILGGSGAQSLMVHEAGQQLWQWPMAPRTLLDQPPTKFGTRFTNGAWIRTLMASQTSVRGPHPQRLRLDEIDEMDLEILQAAQGQPMRDRTRGIETQTVMSSTHQYPDKCVAHGTLVWTARGEIPVQDVVAGDRVMTRRGWRPVKAVMMSGYQPVVAMRLSNGRTLVCTDDHRIAMFDSDWSIPKWFLADPSTALAGLDPRPFTLTDPTDASTTLDVGVMETVTTDTVSLPGVLCRCAFASQDVHGVGDRFQVDRVAAGTHSAQVVNGQSVCGTNQADVRPAMSATTKVLAVDPAVPLGLPSLPDPAVGVQWSRYDIAPIEEPVFVVDSHTVRVLQPTYDLEVEDVHEFVAEGVVVHNTMSAMLERAKDRNWPVFEWCWRETTNPIDGWLTNDEVQRKRQEITQAMWDAEYDLQEPSFEGRAIDPDALEAAFMPDLGDTDEDVWESGYEAQVHTTGIDWARKKDWTVMLTFAHDNDPWVLTAARRMQRQPWPVMIHFAAQQWRKYGGRLAHDATGIGDVVSDYLKSDFHRSDLKRFTDVIMSSGRSRQDLFNEYINAIESGLIVFPRIKWLYEEHKYVTIDDLYGNGHPPDSVVAGAIAWSQRGGRKKIGLPVEISREDSPWAV